MSTDAATLKEATEAKEELSISVDQPNSSIREHGHPEGLKEDTTSRLPTGTVVGKGVRSNQETPIVAEVARSKCDDPHSFWALMKLAGYTEW